MSTLINITLNQEDQERIGRIGGWAPGSYIGKCQDCGGEIMGDKRSSQCFVCAVVSIRPNTIEACAKVADEWGKGKWQVETKGRKRFDINDMQAAVNTTGRGIAEDIRECL